MPLWIHYNKVPQIAPKEAKIAMNEKENDPIQSEQTIVPADIITEKLPEVQTRWFKTTKLRRSNKHIICLQE